MTFICLWSPAVAQESALLRKLTPETLRGLLSELLGRAESPRTFRKVAA